MRTYGTSPLFSYVELVFRCKRLFIISIILGTVITSTVVRMRQTQYSGFFLAQLAGDADLAQAEAAANRRPGAGKDTPATRKADHLFIWITRDNNFLPEVLRDQNMDRGKSAEEFNALVSKVRKAIEPPKMVSSYFVEVGMTWQDKDELEKILNGIYNKFATMTVETETATATARTRLLVEQFAKYDKESKDWSRKRMEYLTKHYWQQGAMASVAMGQLDKNNSQLADTTMELAEGESRLKVIEAELKKTPQKVEESETTTTTIDPRAQLQTQKKEAEADLQKLLQRYSDSHPSVIAKKKEIAAIDEQIKNPPKAVPEGDTVKKNSAYNPKWVQLQQLRTQYMVNVQGLNRRISSLNREIAKQTERVRLMPAEEVNFREIDNEYRLTDQIRNQTEGQLAAARIEEQRDKAIETAAVKQAAKPTPEALDSSGKTVVLYALGPVLGIIIAFAFSLLVETLDHTLRTPVEVERYLNKPVLAVIPRMHTPREGRKRLAGASKPSITS